MREIFACITLQTFDNFSAIFEPMIEHDNNESVILSTTPETLNIFSVILNLMDQFCMKNSICYYVNLQFGAVWNDVKSNQLEKKITNIEFL